MRVYSPTELGEQIAVSTGLDELTDKLIKNEEYTDSAVLTFLTQDESSYTNDICLDDANKELIAQRERLQADELVDFDQGLSVGEGGGQWKYLGENEENTLFPVRAIHRLLVSSEEDGFILSGAAGLVLGNYRQRCPLLARSRYEDYGFASYLEACSFVGAYLVGKVARAEDIRLNRSPSHTISSSSTKDELFVGGSFHGDFSMVAVKTPKSDVYSLLGKPVEFSPSKILELHAYHTSETLIVGSMIEAEYLCAGKEAALTLVGEFEKILDVTKKSPTKRIYPMFADYGDGRIDMSGLRLIVKDDKYASLIKGMPLRHIMVTPGSKAALNVIPTTKGIAIYDNLSASEDVDEKLEIDSSEYVGLFRSFVGQALNAHGRTSAGQLQDLVEQSKAILEGRDELSEEL